MQTEINQPAVKPLSDESNQPDSSDLIIRATKAAERLEAGNKELARLIAVQQQIQAKNAFDGHSSAGLVQQSSDEKETAEARKMLEGTGLEDYAFPADKK